MYPIKANTYFKTDWEKKQEKSLSNIEKSYQKNNLEKPRRRHEKVEKEPRYKPVEYKQPTADEMSQMMKEETARKQKQMNNKRKNLDRLKKLGMLGGKRIRKHKGINQQTGRLKKGYKYTGKRLKNGLPQILKVK